jgi:ATP-dependent exoDNAse (exonuclease V) alpha subunit
MVIDHDELAEALTASSSTFGHIDILRAVAERARQGATVDQIEAHADAFLVGRHVVRLADGVYTTRQMLRLERRLLTKAQARLGAGVGVVSPAIIDAELMARPRLSDEQARMVHQLTSSGNGVDIVLGVAGAGKTSGLECARAAWDAGGHHLFGVALAARAAAELRAQSGIPSITLDSFLTTLDHRRERLPSRAVLILDEAAMVDTRRLARLLEHASTANAKVVLVGDDHQLPEIEAGGAFTGLLRRLPAVVLAENRRQTDPIDERALAELRTGNAAPAVQHLMANGRITVVPTSLAAHEQMTRDWVAARTNGEDVVMLAVRRVEVHELNQLARAQLVATGEVQREGIEVAGHEFAIGDRVMALNNRRGLGIANGDRGTLTTANEKGVTINLDRGPTINLPTSYLDAGHLTHAYATTIHKAQGMTCDRTLVLASGALFREAGYTALSRGRTENRLYVIAPEPPDVDVGHGIYGAHDGPLDELVAALSSAPTTSGSLSISSHRPFRPRSKRQTSASTCELGLATRAEAARTAKTSPRKKRDTDVPIWRARCVDRCSVRCARSGASLIGTSGRRSSL